MLTRSVAACSVGRVANSHRIPTQPLYTIVQVVAVPPLCLDRPSPFDSRITQDRTKHDVACLLYANYATVHRVLCALNTCSSNLMRDSKMPPTPHMDMPRCSGSRCVTQDAPPKTRWCLDGPPAPRRPGILAIDAQRNAYLSGAPASRATPTDRQGGRRQLQQQARRCPASPKMLGGSSGAAVATE